MVTISDTSVTCWQIGKYGSICDMEGKELLWSTEKPLKNVDILLLLPLLPYHGLLLNVKVFQKINIVCHCAWNEQK